MKTLDLRSDTVTRPTEAMRRAMAQAEVGDDVYGEDPTVRRLEEAVAERLGAEAALFTASGTLANQLAVGLHCRAGDEVLGEASSHLFNDESGGMAALWGVQPSPISGARGLINAAQLATAIRPPADWSPRTRALWLENTHNRGGGTVWPVAEFAAVAHCARTHGLRVHLDGARLFNAAIAHGVAPQRWAEHADTVSVCFSKGLGAPVGSALAGKSEEIREARRLRKRLGGGMRQAGVLAAAALYALEHHVERLASDHRNAKNLAEGLSALGGVTLVNPQVETNIVLVKFGAPAAQVCAALRTSGVLASPFGPETVRFVTHLDLAEADISALLERVGEGIKQGGLALC